MPCGSNPYLDLVTPCDSVIVAMPILRPIYGEKKSEIRAGNDKGNTGDSCAYKGAFLAIHIPFRLQYVSLT